MTIEVKNDTDRYVAFVGSSTLGGLDGSTVVRTEGDIQSVKISKSKGTDGLFTALSFIATTGTDPSKNVPFTIWSTMGAGPGSTVAVKLVDATPIINGDLNQLRTSEWADKIYAHADWQQDNVDRAKFKVGCCLSNMATTHSILTHSTDQPREDQCGVSQFLLQAAH
jgi:hypothetical protein